MNTREILHDMDDRFDQVVAAARASHLLNSALDYCNSHSRSDGKAVMEFLCQDESFRQYVDDNRDSVKRALANGKPSSEVIGEWIGMSVAITGFLRKYPPNDRTHAELARISSSSIDQAKLSNSLADHRCISADQCAKSLTWLEKEILPLMKKLHDYRNITGEDWAIIRRLCDDAGFAYTIETFEDHTQGVAIKKFAIKSVAVLATIAVFAFSLTAWMAAFTPAGWAFGGPLVVIPITELISAGLGWVVGKLTMHGTKHVDDAATANANRSARDLGYNEKNIPILCKQAVSIYAKLYSEFTRVLPYDGADGSTTTTTTVNSDGTVTTGTSSTVNNGIESFVEDVYEIAYAILSVNLGAIRNMVEILAVVQR